MAAGKASGRAYAAKAGFGCRAGKELDDGSGNAGRAFLIDQADNPEFVTVSEI